MCGKRRFSLSEPHRFCIKYNPMIFHARLTRCVALSPSMYLFHPPLNLCVDEKRIDIWIGFTSRYFIFKLINFNITPANSFRHTGKPLDYLCAYIKKSTNLKRKWILNTKRTHQTLNSSEREKKSVLNWRKSFGSWKYHKSIFFFHQNNNKNGEENMFPLTRRAYVCVHLVFYLVVQNFNTSPQGTDFFPSFSA